MSIGGRRFGFIACLCGLLFFDPPAFALTAGELLLISNQNMPQSQALAEYYAKTRLVPANNILELDLPATEEMSFECYEENVVPQLRKYLREHDPANHIKCLVTFYGVPFRIAAHVDTDSEKSEIAVLKSQLKTVMVRLESTAGDAEAVARKEVAGFKPLVPGSPLADPEGSVAIDNVARRVDFAGKSIVGTLAKVGDPAKQETIKQEIIGIVKKLAEPIEGLIETPIVGTEPSAKFATTGPATTGTATTGPATTGTGTTGRAITSTAGSGNSLAEERELLQDRRYDPAARRSLRISLAKTIGLLNYAKVVLGQIGYLSPADSEAATDSELSLLKVPFYSRERWQLNSLNYRFGASLQTPAMMVSRLDAPDPKIVRQMIADANTVEQHGLSGKFVIDSRGLVAGGGAKENSYATYDQSLRNLAALVHLKTSIAVVFDEKPEVLPPHAADNVALYCGWYSVGNYVPACTFVPGAVAFHVASFEMTSLRDPANRGWVRGLLNDGVAATLGPVSEPYLQAFPPADEFFPLLLTGRLTLAEIYWKTELMSSWRMCLIGDPLYCPFAIRSAIKVSDLPVPLQRLCGNAASTTQPTMAH